MSIRLRRVLALVASPLALGVQPVPAAAHDARPVSVSIRELPGERFAMRLRTPDTVAPANRPRVVPPPGCRPDRVEPDDGAPARAGPAVLACPGGLAGRPITLDWPHYNPSLATLYRFQPLEGTARTALLAPSEPGWTVPAEPSRSKLIADYLRLGIEHIAGGLDHLLFVAGLLLVAGGVRRSLVAVTGFTLAHSLTLALATLGLARLPGPPVEAAIALSILFLAVEIARGRQDSLAFRHPALVASVFGLLHGFGFAGVLHDIGVPQNEVASALFAFNVGVEIGQLAFVAALLALALGWAQLRAALAVRQPRLAGVPAVRVSAYGLGTVAAFWLIERLAQFA